MKLGVKTDKSQAYQKCYVVCLWSKNITKMAVVYFKFCLSGLQTYEGT